MTSVKTNREYSVEEVLEGLKTTDLPEPYKYQGPIGGPVLYVPGSGSNDIQVHVKKGKITLVDTPRPKDALKSVGKEVLEETLFGSWAVIFRNNNPNKVLEKKVAAELMRMFA